MKAIRTEYAGTSFRSRLEARWAAFFDLLGWKWEYEPFDLDGWIPDFALYCDKDAEFHVSREFGFVLVEVRPYLSESEWTDRISEIKKSLISRYGKKDYCPEVLLCGIRGLYAYDDFAQISFMLSGPADEMYVDETVFKTDSDLTIFDFSSAYMDWDCRITNGNNKIDRESWVYSCNKDQMCSLIQLWRKAGNAVQWKR